MVHLQGSAHGHATSLPALLKGMCRLTTLACEGCSSLSEAPLAGLPLLASLKVCRLNKMTSVCDSTCRELAALTKVLQLGPFMTHFGPACVNTDLPDLVPALSSCIGSARHVVRVHPLGSHADGIATFRSRSFSWRVRTRQAAQSASASHPPALLLCAA